MKSADLKPNRRVLVIDDNNSIHTDFRKILCGENERKVAVKKIRAALFDTPEPVTDPNRFEMDSAFQGQEGLEMVKKSLAENRPYAMAFVDVRMPPGWDGVETIARIWEVDPSIQIVVCTAYSDYAWDDMRAKVGQPDSMLVLKKPFDNIEVRQIAHALTKKWFLNQQSALQLAELAEDVAERTRAEITLQKQFTRLSLLNQITHSISDRQDTESILHVLLRQLEDHLDLDLGGVALFDPQADTVNIAALRIKNPLLAAKLDLHEGTVLPFADTGLGQCKQSQTVYLPDTLKSPGVMIEKVAGIGARSVVAVPMMVDNRLFGVILCARLKPDGFNSGDCEFLRMLSEQVAVAAHQARLHAELARAYNELRQTQQAVMQQERLTALGQMASGIAHDVNNALSPVVGFADLILMSEHGLTINGKRYLKHIRTAGQDIAHIVERLREFYRRRDEKESMQQFNFNTLAEQVVDMLRPRWRDMPQQRGLTVEVVTELAPDLPRFAGIESEIREAMTNLVLNAVDALPEGGRITVRTQLLTRDPSESKYTNYIALEISDTGVGMSEETRRRCLEPFFSTKGMRGTGLGLAMVYGVTQRHEGTIEILSEVGKGTTFRLILPVRKMVCVDSEPLDKGGPVTPMRILCIDDEPLLCELLKEILERDGHTVETSDGGQSGLNAFRKALSDQKPFDVVITDLGMPYLDGREVVKVLRAESPRTPIVMLTGWGAFMKEEDPLPKLVDELLSKPPRSGEIRDTLRRVVCDRAARFRRFTQPDIATVLS